MTRPDVGETWRRAERAAEVARRWRLAARAAVMVCAGVLYVAALAALGS